MRTSLRALSAVLLAAALPASVKAATPADMVIWGGPIDTADLSLWVGFAVFCSYAVASVVLGGLLFTRRDA